MALWVEKHRPNNGHEYISEQIERLESSGAFEGAKLWRKVSNCHSQLSGSLEGKG